MVDGVCYNIITGTDNVEIANPGYSTPYESTIIIPATVSRENKAHQVTEIEDRTFSNTGNLTSINRD
jgi:hypothetical protein